MGKTKSAAPRGQRVRTSKKQAEKPTAFAAKVQCDGDKYYLDIALEDDIARIPLSDDNAIPVKSAFNKLIRRSRSGAFTIELSGASDDLFSQVAIEYVTQLNRELQDVRAEMQQHDLLVG